MADALQTFLLTYRTTPCASLSGLKTPAEPPDMPETEEVHVSPEPQEPRPARTRPPPRRLEMDSQEEVPHRLGGGGVVGALNYLC